jgi:plastocyanin
VGVRPATSLAAVAAALALAAPGGAASEPPKLLATVGPGATIQLRHLDGSRVVQLDPGEYTIVVEDLSEEHNFRLLGPGVNRATGVEELSNDMWNVTLVAGSYRFLCDPHAGTMRGTFHVGPLPPPPPPSVRLVGTVGPGASISLRTPAGANVKAVRAGAATVTVRDRAAVHNFRLVGPGVNRATTVKGRGTATWRVTLRQGATYRFLCDPHRLRMKGSFRAT